MSVLQFPFYKVKDWEITGFEKVVKALPEDFKDGTNAWTEVFNMWYFGGVEWSEWKYKNPELKEAQMHYLRNCSMSFEPKHEVKIAVCSYLLSQMLKELPTWKPIRTKRAVKVKSTK